MHLEIARLEHRRKQPGQLSGREETMTIFRFPASTNRTAETAERRGARRSKRAEADAAANVLGNRRVVLPDPATEG